MTTTTATVTMMMMMMMMMVVVCVSAASLGGSRRVETNTTSPQRLTENQENVSTGLKSHQDANETLDDSISVVFFRPEPHEDVNKTVVDATRIKSHQDVNETLVDPTRDSASNSSRNETSFTPLMFVFPLDGLSEQQQLNRTENKESDNRKEVLLAAGPSIRRIGSPPPVCQLSICAVINLGHELQSGGDEVAGQSSSDPFGHGK
ncbi:uncharacterized protein LOC103366447 isoform X2 [Stegastes partitus]|uniref:Uncharacterized protein LOC103366447 isoform X2 n=1 Tax=Stegastes partitus TaxID=144197 RepID=A0A9Y4KLV4_9TELE|nr:PREDICTED: uncharacterized protein LOC103366447 isoform X2 [Stegastes partitus]